MRTLDLLILSNGPGEVTTWVRPLVRSIRTVFGEDREQVRVSVVLSPCPHASGQEVNVLKQYPQVDRIQASKDFYPFLLWGKTAQNWDWRPEGVVIFLGGDQLFPVLIGKHLSYPTVVYAEWEARWPSLIDFYGVRNSQVKQKVPPKYHHKLQVVGDLMLDLDDQEIPYNAQSSLIGLMVGSKANKLKIGVPFCLAIAQFLHSQRPQLEFIIPLAPTVTLDMIAQYADLQNNPFIEKIQGVSAALVLDDIPYLITPNGLKIKLITSFPAYEHLRQCSLVVTTVGANTAELGGLAIPMWVLLPTQHIEVMREGIVGLMTRLPLIGGSFASMINKWLIGQKRLYAWPNIWSKTEIVPERIGLFTPQDIAEEILDYLNNPAKLQEIRVRLEEVRTETGAATKLAHIIQEQLD